MTEGAPHSEKERGWSRVMTTLAFAALWAVAIASYAAWYFLHVTHWGADYSNAGAFGDAFGPIAGLLSSLTLAAAVLSVFMQRSELALQRRELEETREVFKAQEESQRALAKVQGESLENAKALVKALERLAEVSNRDANTSDARYVFEQQRFRWDEWAFDRKEDREEISMIAAILNAQVSLESLKSDVTGRALQNSARQRLQGLDDRATQLAQAAAAAPPSRAPSVSTPNAKAVQLNASPDGDGPDGHPLQPE